MITEYTKGKLQANTVVVWFMLLAGCTNMSQISKLTSKAAFTFIWYICHVNEGDGDFTIQFKPLYSFPSQTLQTLSYFNHSVQQTVDKSPWIYSADVQSYTTPQYVSKLNFTYLIFYFIYYWRTSDFKRPHCNASNTSITQLCEQHNYIGVERKYVPHPPIQLTGVLRHKSEKVGMRCC